MFICFLDLVFFLFCVVFLLFFFSSRRRHTRCALVTGVQTCALPISLLALALFLAGAAAASTASASGRVVVGWFPPERRGLAMGIRQMAQPVGVGVGAISIAVIADRPGISTALWVPTLAALGALSSEARRVGQVCVSPRTARWMPCQ